MANAFPLQWPEGWKRTPPEQQRQAKYKVTPEIATRELLHSLSLLGAERRSIVISSNVPVRQDGLPYAAFRVPEDSGVAVYWTTAAHGERVMACDRWTAVYANIRAIGLAAEGLRAIERAGASQILERAFTAFGALPASPDAIPVRPWWEVLSFDEKLVSCLSMPVVEARFRELLPKVHPDHTGSDAACIELNRAREDARKHFARATPLAKRA